MMGFGLLGLLFSMVILVGIIVLVIWAVKRFTAPGNAPSGNQSAREILQARYAHGEITREQYQQMLSDLS